MKKREIFIELTSLLDVILIMLFVILSQAKLQTDEALGQSAQAQTQIQAMQQELETAKSENELLDAQLGKYRRQELSLGVVEENSLIVTISVQQGDVRYILVEQQGGMSQSIALDAQDANYSQNKLRSTVSNLISDSGKQTVFVVFQYERQSIYQSEYRLIGSVVQELKAEAKEAEIALNYIETDILEQ